MTRRIYMAVAVSGGWSVGMTTGGSVKPLGDVRKFGSYEEADECAKWIASGKCETLYAGEYVSNR